MSDSPHDNDADSRPRIYKRATSKHGEIEVTVKGSEGESTEDISEEAIKQFEDAQEGQSSLRKKDEQPGGRSVT